MPTPDDDRPTGLRRAARDLLPVTLAAGAAALVVSLVVGGSTAQLAAPTPPGPDTAVVERTEVPASDVVVRPAPARRPASTALDLARGGLLAGPELAFAPPVAPSSSLAASVRGAHLTRPSSGLAIAAGPVVSTTTPVPEPVVAVAPVAVPAPVTTGTVAIASTPGKRHAGKPKPLTPAASSSSSSSSPPPAVAAAADDPGPGRSDAAASSSDGADDHPGQGKGQAKGWDKGNGPR